jgi:hypothetical protein
MKKLTFALFILFSMLTSTAFSQDFIELTDGQDSQINGLLVSYTVIKKGNKKGMDLYRLTATITNQGADYIQIFSTSPEIYIEKAENSLAYFQFTNATGKGLSATSGRFYPKPMYIKVPYKFKKCPPIAKDEDPYEHRTKSALIGTKFAAGSTLSKVFNIRVPEGETPQVRVMIY